MNQVLILTVWPELPEVCTTSLVHGRSAAGQRAHGSGTDLHGLYIIGQLSLVHNGVLQRQSGRTWAKQREFCTV